ncbi:putative metalloprotease CJM1_0395 family protein, partial [Candidatus Sumerlaeota bacterium]
YQMGPDGKRYVVGGSVRLDMGKESSPEQTIQKARVIKRAALAPAEPSGADRRVAAQASQMERSAQAEKRDEDQREAQEATQQATGQAVTAPSGQPNGLGAQPNVAGAIGPAVGPAVSGASGTSGPVSGTTKLTAASSASGPSAFIDQPTPQPGGSSVTPVAL